mgnify:CR=1 FL=1
MSFYDAIRVGASGAADFTVERSLRFNDDDSAYLSKTPSSAGNRKTFTYSCWFKRGNLGTQSGAFLKAGPTSSNYFKINIANDHKLYVLATISGAYTEYFRSTQLFRDTSAWMHLVLRWDTTNSTAGDRVRVYLNGTEVTDHSGSNPALNLDGFVNDTNQHEIGASTVNSQYWDGYIAEVNLIDGFSYDPSYFGETNAETGQWNPKKYTGGYGTNGFYLNFSDNSGTTATTLGKDSSGNGNNFTPNNFVTGDAVKDTPSNNFAVLNVLSKSSGVTTQEGNLYAQGSSGWRTVVGNFHMSSGKWYWEIQIKQVGNSIYGILPATRANGRQDFYADIYTGSYSDEWGYSAGGTLYNSASGTSSWGSTYTVGDILGFALDMDNGTLDIKKNGSTTGSQITGISTTKEYRAAFTYYTSGTQSNINFGQDSTFAGQKTAQGNTDGSGQGDFYYAPPSGYKALCSANLPDPTILLPNKHFDTVLYTGDGNATRTFSNVLEFQPDWFWTKIRDANYAHLLYDSVRGPGQLKALASQTKGAEGAELDNTTYGYLNSFDANGFSVTKGSSSTNFFNQSSKNYVTWNWNAGNTDGVTYRVVVVTDSGNKYRFRNSANTATFAQSAVTLDLAEGGTYIFDGSDSSMDSHPIVLAENSNGSPMYETGVTYELDGSAVANAAAYASGYASATTRRLLFTVPASAPNLYYVCYNHLGMGGAINTNTTLGSSNFDGSTQSTVKANTSAGFSIVLYTGQQNATDTIGHGLGVQPQVVISKSRNSTYTYTQWYVYHHKLSTNYFVFLNETNAQGNGLGDYYVDASFSSTVFAVGDDIYGPNVSNNNYVAYCFSEVAGYSKFGSYTGNGNAEGTFVFTGFRPAWLLIKNYGASGFDWVIQDNKRSPFNLADNKLNSNTSSAEQTDYDKLDILSNGFKSRVADAGINANGASYIYLAFAESPFKNSRAR